MSSTASPPSYAKDIQPLFTQIDRDHMLQVRRFDLWKYADVKNWAPRIYQAVSEGSMPPGGSEPEAPWSDEKVSLFKAWMDSGYLP